MMEYIMERFARNVREGPDLPFLYDDLHREGLTFRQFDNLSGRVYAWLKARGIGRESFVLINLARGVRIFTAAAGVWKAGAAFVIVEENYAPERIAFIRRDCGCTAEINQESLEQILHTAPLFGWEKPEPHDAAFAVYTSGTTGNPKGVLHEYGNIDRCLRSMEMEGNPMLGKGIFRPYTSPMTFVAAVIGLTAMMAADHARMYIVSYAAAKNPQALLNLYQTYGFNMGFMSPSYARELGPMLAPYLKTLVVASEPAGNLYFPGVRLLNFYGGSESYFLVAVFDIDRPWEIAPVGKPRFPLDVRLLDEDGREVPDGETGEIVYDNPYFRGYIHLPDETARVKKNGYFHTGDLARKDADGNIIVLGRADDMVKINGNRVEPAEIENAAKRILGIDWAAVRTFTEEKGNGTICLYYTADISFDPEEIRKKMAECLPYYMIPTSFLRIDRIPLRPSGKLDRKALPDPREKESRKGYMAPKNETEAALCSAFGKVLDVGRAGVNEDFYELGGDSLHAIRLVMESGLPGLDAGMIFRGRTPEKIAALYLAEHGEQEDSPPEIRLCAAQVRPHPLTTEQTYMLDVQLYTPVSTMYNLAYLLRAEGKLDAERLARAAEKAILAHPSLLTVLSFSEEGVPVQTYRPEYITPVCVERISEKDLEKLKDSLIQPFRIIEKPLHRCRVFETEETVYLFLDIHHIMFDGTSFRLLLKDLDRCYAGGEPEKDLYYLFLESREKEQDSSFYLESRRYFETKYGGTRWETHPRTDYAVRENVSAEVFFLAETAPRAMARAEKRFHVSRNELLIAATLLSLSAYNQTADVMTSWIYNGRMNLQFANTTGLLFRDLPVGIHMNEAGTLKKLLREVRKQVQDGMKYSVYPFTETAFTGLRGMNTCLLYQQGIYGAPSLGGTTLRPVEIPHPADASQTILDIEVMDGEDGMKILLDYAGSLYQKESIERFGACLNRALILLTSPETEGEIKVADLLSAMKEV